MSDVGQIIKKSALITSYPLNTGVGTYAKELYNLGFFREFLFFKTYFGGDESEFTSVVHPRNRTMGVIDKTLSVLLKHNRYARCLDKFSYVHFADPDFFHMAKHKEAVGTIHDLFSFEKGMKEDYSFLQRKYYEIELSHADDLKGILTISYQSKRKIQELFPNLDPTVIHLWTDDSFIYRDKVKARKMLNLPLDKIIILNVSGDYKRKNIDILPRIMDNLDSNYLLLRIGPSERIRNQFHNRNFEFYSYVNKETYPYFFNAADIAIMPSLEEGFGRPVIQAINSGIPVIASDIGIFKEILGSYKYLADPKNPDDWVEKIKDLEEKSGYSGFAQKLYAKISDYYRPDRALRQHIEYYKKVGFLVH
ncbi:MAG: glycosyltransferase [Caldisphaera sp.]